jgi:hypothetical protein
MPQLSDEQWDRIKEQFPEENLPERRPGCKPVPARRVLEAVLWILNTGTQRVYDAAYPRLVGDHRALRAVGLPRVVDLGEASTILRIAYGCLRAENQAARDADGGTADSAMTISSIALRPAARTSPTAWNSRGSRLGCCRRGSWCR